MDRKFAIMGDIHANVEALNAVVADALSKGVTDFVCVGDVVAVAHLGDGAVVDKADWHTIPRGYLWNIHRVGDKTTCHWGLSLGDNVAAACNNTDESPTKKLAYEFGNTFYGRFNFRDICDVLNGTDKYGHSGTDAPTKTNIVVRQVNPLTVASYY